MFYLRCQKITKSIVARDTESNALNRIFANKRKCEKRFGSSLITSSIVPISSTKPISSIISKFATEKCIAMSVKARNGSIISITITIMLYVIAFRLRLFHLVIVAITFTIYIPSPKLKTDFVQHLRSRNLAKNVKMRFKR